jgi:porin
VELGIDFSLEGTVGLAGAARGGESLQGLALARADWIAPERSGATALAAHASVLGLAGRGPTTRYLDDSLGASNQEADPAVRLYAWWAEWSHGATSLRVGAQLADEEFATTEGGGAFLHSAFGWPAFISANALNSGPAFPVAALGLRWRQEFSPSTSLQVGIYDGDAFDSASGDPHVNRHGVRYRLGGEQGWFSIGEFAWRASDELAFKLGAWLHTAEFEDLRDDVAGQPHAVSGMVPRRHGENYGAFAAVEYALGGATDGDGAATNFFARIGLAPSNRSEVAWAVDVGVSHRGLWPGRPDDVVYLGVVHAAFSKRLAEHERLSGPDAVGSDYERVIEVGYAIALSEHWSVRPDVQHIRFAGGRAVRRDAIVLLLRSAFSF